MKKLSFVGWFLAASSVVLALGSCQEEQLPATISGLPDGDITFLWNDTGSKTVSIESNYDWTFEEEDEHDIIEVTRTAGTNDLVITPHINYSRKAYTASVRIVSGSGSYAAERVITVSQGANSDTYLNFLDADLAGQDNPIIMFESRPDGEPTVKEILISTNNVLSVEVSADQDVTIPGTEEPSEPEEDEETGETQAAPGTKVDIPGYGWMSYGISSRQTEEGPVTVLTLTCQMNESPTASLTLAIDVVSGNEDIDNTIETKRIGLVSMPSTPAIVVNPQEGLTFAYNDDKPQTFSVAANVEYDDLTETENATYHWFTKSGSWDSGYPVVTLAEDNGNVKVYSVTVPANYAAEDRQVSLSFRQRNEGEGLDPVYAKVIFTQTAAPQASVSLNETVLIINSDRQNATLTVETSIPELTAVECLDDSGEKADWFQAEYNARINQIVIEFDPAGEEERNGTLTVNVGTGMNKASASVDIIQLSTQPSLMLNPASVQLNQAGDPVTVSVITNQDSWSIDSSVSSDFSIVEDHEANTITISGTEVTSDMFYIETEEVEIAGHEFTEDTHFAVSNAFASYLFFTDGTDIYRLNNSGSVPEFKLIASLNGLTTVDGEPVGSINEIVDMRFRVDYDPTGIDVNSPTRAGIYVLTVAYNTADGGGITEIYLSNGGDLDHTTSYTGFGPIVGIDYMARMVPIGTNLGARDYID